jgi:hypothetical protein
MEITSAAWLHSCVFRFSPLVGARGSDRAKVSWAQFKDEWVASASPLDAPQRASVGAARRSTLVINHKIAKTLGLDRGAADATARAV